MEVLLISHCRYWFDTKLFRFSIVLYFDTLWVGLEKLKISNMNLFVRIFDNKNLLFSRFISKINLRHPIDEVFANQQP